MDAIKKVGLSAAEYWRPTRPREPTPVWVRKKPPIPTREVNPDNLDLLVQKLDKVAKEKQD